ncbi:DUF4192 domain-containing protein [Nocardioides marmoraquaticus]
MSNRRRPHASTRPAGTRVVPRVPEPREPYLARDEADLVAMVPLALGFHPHASVVLMTFGRAAFHARVDLPDPGAMSQGAGEEVAEMLVHAAVANGADRAAVLLYTDDHDRARLQGELLVAALHAGGLEVVDVLRVHDRRWFEPLRGDVTGTPVALETHRFTARGVYEGQVVQLDRSALAAGLHGGDDVERRHLSRAAGLRGPLLGRGVQRAVLRGEAAWVRERVARVVGAVRRGEGPGVDTADAARLLVAVVRGDLRDAAWVDLDRERADDHVVLWRDLVQRSPEELVASAGALLALAAYLSGDGALAWVALDRVAQVDRAHSLAGLVADALTAAVPPSAWPPCDPASLPLLRGA